LKPFFMAIKKHSLNFLSLPGIVSIGMGMKTTGDLNTGVPALVFGVEKKLPIPVIPPDQRIPRIIDRLPTDVVEMGKIKLLGYALPPPKAPPDEPADPRKQKVRPAQPGISIGHYKTTAGTFGAVVQGDFPGGIAILGNNHVLANGTAGNDGLSFPGDPILQPGPYDKGTSKDIIARLHSFSPMLAAKKDGSGPLNSVDAALAIPLEPELITSPVLDLGSVTSTIQASPGMTVFKSGRSSGVTRGNVISMGNTIRVENEKKTYIYQDQIGFTAKSEGGDSGSLVVNQFGKAVGLLFAGSERITFANPIDMVLKYFGVTLSS